jgi:tripeptide aminopeptidase
MKHKKLDIEPIQSAIRAGQRQQIQFYGLPTPNLFAGGHNIHAYPSL